MPVARQAFYESHFKLKIVLDIHASKYCISLLYINEV